MSIPERATTREEYAELYIVRINQIKKQVEARRIRGERENSSVYTLQNSKLKDYYAELEEQYKRNATMFFGPESALYCWALNKAQELEKNMHRGNGAIYKVVGLADFVLHAASTTPFSTEKATLDEILRITAIPYSEPGETTEQLRKEVFQNPAHKYKFKNEKPTETTTSHVPKEGDLW